jgi:quercetin dioxygenase-like cupin family protein
VPGPGPALTAPIRIAEHRCLHGGEGTVRVADLLHPHELPPFTAVLWCELEPGARVGRHQQQRDPEILVCIDGEGTVEVDGVTRPLVRGLTVLLPFGSALALRNPGDEPLVYLIVKARG